MAQDRATDMVAQSAVDAVLRGDREAFRVLVDREAPNVVRTCFRILGEQPEAEDAAQEAFVTAFRSLATWRADGPFGGFCRRRGLCQFFRARMRGLLRPLLGVGRIAYVRAIQREPEMLALHCSPETRRVLLSIGPASVSAGPHVHTPTKSRPIAGLCGPYSGIPLGPGQSP